MDGERAWTAGPGFASCILRGGERAEAHDLQTRAARPRGQGRYCPRTLERRPAAERDARLLEAQAAGWEADLLREEGSGPSLEKAAARYERALTYRSVASGVMLPHRAGAARSFRREHDHDLHSCPQPRRPGCAEPRRRTLMRDFVLNRLPWGHTPHPRYPDLDITACTPVESGRQSRKLLSGGCFVFRVNGWPTQYRRSVQCVFGGQLWDSMTRPMVMALIVLASASCGAGDNSAVRRFHPTVKKGMPLVEVIAEGEKAQSADIIYSVNGRDCPDGEVRAGRHNEEPYIRVTQRAPDAERPWAQPYREVGYPTRETFRQGLAQTMPSFFSCKVFYFTFGRYQGWPSSDSFSVTVDADGRILSVSELSKNVD